MLKGRFSRTWKLGRQSYSPEGKLAFQKIFLQHCVLFISRLVYRQHPVSHNITTHHIVLAGGSTVCSVLFRVPAQDHSSPLLRTIYKLGSPSSTLKTKMYKEKAKYKMSLWNTAPVIQECVGKQSQSYSWLTQGWTRQAVPTWPPELKGSTDLGDDALISAQTELKTPNRSRWTHVHNKGWRVTAAAQHKLVCEPVEFWRLTSLHQSKKTGCGAMLCLFIRPT